MADDEGFGVIVVPIAPSTNAPARSLVVAARNAMGVAVRGDGQNYRSLFLSDIGAISRQPTQVAMGRRFDRVRQWIAQNPAAHRDLWTQLRRVRPFYNGRNEEILKTMCTTLLFVNAVSDPEENARRAAIDSLRDDADGEGMDAEKAEEYFTSHLWPEIVRHGLEYHFHNAAVAAQLPPRFKIRIDIYFTTEDAGDHRPHPKAQPPQGWIGSTIRDVPRVWPAKAAWDVATPGTINQIVRDMGEEFIQDMTEVMPNKDSNRKLKSVLAAQIFAFRTNAPAAGGSLYGMRRSAASFKPAIPREGDEEALEPITKALYLSTGIALCDGIAEDGRCILASLLLGLDSVLASRSDSDLLPILLQARQGYADKLALVTAKRLPIDPEDKAGFVQRARTEFDSFLAQLAQVKAMYGVQKRHVQTEAGRTAEKYTARAAILRAKLVYRMVQAGTHSLVQLHDDFFLRPQPLCADTMERLNALARKLPGHPTLPAFKVQAWTVGQNDKIGMLYRAPGATLDYLLKGGRVVNLLFAHEHVSLVVEVGRCCNIVGTEFAGRLYCGLCGFYVSRNHNGKLAIYQHQQLGCPSMAGARMTAPLSPANLRGFGKYGMRARNLPLLVGFLDVSEQESDPPVAALRLVAPVPRMPTAESRSYAAYKGFAAGELFGSPESWDSFYECFHFSKPVSRAAYAAGAESDNGSITLATPRALLERLCAPSTVEGIMKRLSFVGPMIQEHIDELKPAAESHCWFCRLPVTGPSLLSIMATNTSPAPQRVEDAFVCEGDEIPDDEERVEFLCDADAAAAEVAVHSKAPVKHHCHATGLVYWAHSDCNVAGFQSSSSLTVDVGSPEAMAECARVVCTGSFMDAFLNSMPPSISTFGGQITRIVLAVPALPRPRSQKETALRRAVAAAKGQEFDEAAELVSHVRRSLMITFRPAATFPVAELAALEDVSATGRILWRERNLMEYARMTFNRFRLWPLFFGTNISFSRALLFERSLAVLPPGVCPTSLCDKEMLAVAKRMLTGGRLIMGEAVRMSLPDPLDRRSAIMLLDVTASYPSQMLRWPLPMHEHAMHKTYQGRAARVTASFEERLERAMEFIEESDLLGSDCILLEISGYFSDELQLKYARFPPVYSKRHVTGADLSCFQRVSLGIDMKKSLGLRSVAHFYPLDKEVVFLRTAKILRRLGFTFTAVGMTWAIPQAKWGAPFAEAMQTARRDAPTKAASDNIKLMSNSVIGSLNVDKSQYGSLSVLRTFPDGSHKERGKSLIDSPRFSLKMHVAGDCELYEMNPARWLHDQSTFAFIFIQAMARDDLVELVWGSAEHPGLAAHFPTSLQIGYGATDSLAFKVSIEPDVFYHVGYTDVRQVVASVLQDSFDMSNIPPASSFFDKPTDLRAAADWEVTRSVCAKNVKRFGALKDATAGAGISELFVNGPNRWAYKHVQHPRDTLPEFTTDVLKGIPREWAAAGGVSASEKPLELADFAASFYNAALPDVSALPPLKGRKRADLVDLGRTSNTEVVRRNLSLWSNTACIVEADEPFRHFPLGASWPEARAAKDKPFFFERDAIRTDAAKAAEAAAGQHGVPDSVSVSAEVAGQKRKRRVSIASEATAELFADEAEKEQEGGGGVSESKEN